MMGKYPDFPEPEYLPDGVKMYKSNFEDFPATIKGIFIVGCGEAVIGCLFYLALRDGHFWDFLLFFLGLFYFVPGVVALYFMFFNAVQDKYKTETTVFHFLGIISFFFFWILIDDIILAITFLVICTVLEHHSLNKALRKKEAETYRKRVEDFVERHTSIFKLSCPKKATLTEIEAWGQNMLRAYNKGQESSEY